MIIPRKRNSWSILNLASKFIGIDQDPSVQAGAGTRAGLFMSGLFLLSVGLVIVLVLDQLLALAVPLFMFAAFNLVLSTRTRLSQGRSNVLALTGHLVASVVSYMLLARIFWVTYRTDSIVATDLGVLKVLSFQTHMPTLLSRFLISSHFPPRITLPTLMARSSFISLTELSAFCRSFQSTLRDFTISAMLCSYSTSYQFS